ncbi:mitochondrial ribosomal death-associated protein 3-domain-containing protein [Glomus cerebriforme]|uniref:Small ribosomal subunit protein mS29 n=1 Tax=Glomus cerebriforme TaxID=658196 RepID=A0A397SPB6_9GLOM|nr:mitochondrial ribosomal death-associated protein 3-domain-containing protein [Glomus cerebriforme]
MCKPWIVIYIPNAIQYVNSTFPYIRMESTGEFVQPTLVASLLRQIKLVNERHLININLRRDHQIHRHVIKDNNASQLLDVGINDPHSAQEVFEIFLEEIGNNQEYPVLLAVDEVNAFYTDSEYRDVDDSLLEATKLSLPRTILEYFSGNKDFTYGAVIGALSQNFKPFVSKPLEVALGLSESSLWKPISRTILQYATGLQRFDVKEYSKDEAKGVMDYYYNTSILPQHKEQFFVNHFLATNGNPRKFYLACWKGL